MEQIQSFDNIEEAFAAMRANREAASKLLSAEQKAITFGSKAMRFENVLIFGEIHTIEEIAETEARLGASPEEVDYTIEQTKANEEADLLYGKWHSVLEPAGEFGSVHRVSLWPCPTWLFELARECEWDLLASGRVVKSFVQHLYSDYSQRDVPGGESG